jgi:hypothetical protein
MDHASIPIHTICIDARSTSPGYWKPTTITPSRAASTLAGKNTTPVVEDSNAESADCSKQTGEDHRSEEEDHWEG